MRLMAVGAILALLLLTWRPPTDPVPRPPSASPLLPSDSVAAWAFLRAVAMGPGRDTLRLRLEALPAPSVRAGLGTLARRTDAVRWEGSTQAKGFASSLQRVTRAPGAWRMQLSAPPGAPLVVADSGGVLDSLTMPSTGVVGWQLTALNGVVEVRLPTAALRLDAVDPSVPPAARVVRLVANPGWEAKFLTAALEEAGWRVDGVLAIAPRASVRLGAPVPAPLSPRTVAAVIVLDSAPADVPAIARYVRQGGGVVLAGEAAALPRWRALVPGQIGALEAGLAGALTSERPRLGLAAFALRPAADAVPLVADTLVSNPRVSGPRGEGLVRPLVVARRLGEGRVVVSALHDTWRWRMEGRDDGTAAHRTWWLDLVESVSGLLPSEARPRHGEARWPGARAPYADLVARIGPPSEPPSGPPSGHATASPRTGESGGRGAVASTGADWRLPLFLVALVALLVEWSSRRLRGAR